MRKILYFIIFIFFLYLLSSCMPTGQCSAYGETRRYQRPSSSWNK